MGQVLIHRDPDASRSVVAVCNAPRLSGGLFHVEGSSSTRQGRLAVKRWLQVVTEMEACDHIWLTSLPMLRIASHQVIGT